MQVLFDAEGRFDGATVTGDDAVLQTLLALYDSPVDGPPSVRATMVASLDGETTIDGKSGALSSALDRLAFRVMRSRCDAIVVGAGTARAEGYRPVHLPDRLQEIRADECRTNLPRLVVVSRSLAIDPATPLLNDPATLIVTCVSAPDPARAAIAAVCEVIDAGTDDVDPVTLLKVLAERDLANVLCEGGPTLLTRFLQADAVDELCFTLAPLVAGTPGHRLLSNPTLTTPLAYSLQHVVHDDGFLLTRYARR